MFDMDVTRHVRDDFRKAGMGMGELRPLVTMPLITRFLKCVRGAAATNIVTCYHGTNSNNFESIRKLGLVVPGQGTGSHLRVVHGSALGLGIYLARSPMMASGYCSGGGPNLFVCLALIGNRFVTANNGSVLVITNPHQVLPIGVCHGAPGGVHPVVPIRPPRPPRRKHWFW
eukprot:TRINITY_DN3238_c0_g2_i7.p2 TRINITY_DN3238_c0_g2~~TRINITY_DN3238_c0_g2_i7.p2  ORF type:complete len:172 (+),score=36.10 TRINITY_DN3238_c0_g2_i7:375-890(+)